MKDLVVLVADRDIEQTVLGLLGRPLALKIRPVSHDVVVHPNRDPGCYGQASALLDGFVNTHTHALVVFDRAWDGAPSHDARALERDVEATLARRWPNRSACVVIDPEIEAWVFSDSPHVEDVLGWSGRSPGFRAWLESMKLWRVGEPKPGDPKTAFERALRQTHRPSSSATFRALASRVSVDRCTDASFSRFREILSGWFAAGSER